MLYGPNACVIGPVFGQGYPQAAGMLRPATESAQLHIELTASQEDSLPS